MRRQYRKQDAWLRNGRRRRRVGEWLGQTSRGESLLDAATSPERGGVIGRGIGSVAARSVTMGTGNHETRELCSQRFGAESESVKNRRKVVRKEDVGIGEYLEEYGATLVRFEIDRDTLFVSVHHMHRVVDGAFGSGHHQSAVTVTSRGMLDLENLGTPVGQHRPRGWSEDPTREFYNPNSAEHVDRRDTGHAWMPTRSGTAAVKRKSFSALVRRSFACVSGGRCPMMLRTVRRLFGQFVSVWG